ncbi:hypothetical protein ACPYO6_07380 [Georgenia sp. Z1344]|uniref:hypothetical protein n=1 Tax=Georgenia sp. Z1344 TaxID=3416706 RepID=UPI003CEA6842
MLTDLRTTPTNARPGLLHSADGTVAPVRSTSFDVRAFTRTAFGDHRPPDPPPLGPTDLHPSVRFALTYLRDVERTATSTLRRVLATSTSREARYTAFLTTWAHDRYWFAERLDRALGSPPPTADDDAAAPSTRFDRLAHVQDLLAQHVEPVWTTLVGEPTTALHAVRGLSEESAVLAAHYRVAGLARGALDELLAPLRARRLEHVSFYRAEAAMRLGGDDLAVRLTRALLTRGFHPLRPGALRARASHRFLRTLFAGGGRDEVVRDADAPVRALPGLGGHGPLATALRRERPLVPPVPPVASGHRAHAPRTPTDRAPVGAGIS